MRPVLVLRPEPGAAATAAAARRIGLKANVAPMFVVQGIEFDLPSGAAADALLLTSANAVRFAGLRARSLMLGPAYAVGEATAAAARAAGFESVVVGGPDAAATITRAVEDGVRRLLHLAGREHRAVAHPALTIDRVIVYAAEAVDRLPAAACRALEHDAVALLHSPRAAALFAQLVIAAGLSRGSIAALSPAVAAAAGPGWRAVAVAPRPTDAALLAAAARLCEEGPHDHADRR